MSETSKGNLRETAFQILRFAVVGVFATALHYGIYLLLLHLFSEPFAYTIGCEPVSCTIGHETIAYSIGYVLSFICNFILTCLFTFRKKASKKRGVGFGLAHLVNYGLHVSLLNLFLWIGISDKLAPIPVFCIAVPVNFLLVRFVFNRD